MLTATVVGNIGRDAELNTTGNGTTVCSFSVAHSAGKRGENQETIWVRCTLFGRRAEALAQYLTKGTKVLVAGEARLFTSQKTGTTSLEIIANQVELLSSSTGNQTRRSERSQPRPQQSEEKPSVEDDIPF